MTTRITSSHNWVAPGPLPLLHDEQFVAAYPSHLLSNWRMYFQLLGSGEHTDQVLSWLEHGYSIDWVKPRARSQLKHPLHKTKMTEVQALLQTIWSPEQAQRALRQSKPTPAQFPNRPSARLNAHFVTAEIQELWDRGAIRELGPGHACVVNPLGVVGPAGGKQRLILDARYPNAFVKYVAFHYQSLSHLPTLAQGMKFLLISDLKAGYHHVPLADQDQPYLAFAWQGKVFAFTVLPFGLASACRIYTVVMEEMYRPLRTLGLTLLSYVDDVLHLAQSHTRARVISTCIPLILTFLGIYFSAQKSDWEPKEQGDFLGLTVCLKTQAFYVPSKKIAALLQAITDFRQKPGTKRQLAALVGGLIAVAPAIHLPMLYVRRMFHLIGISPSGTQTSTCERLPWQRATWNTGPNNSKTTGAAPGSPRSHSTSSRAQETHQKRAMEDTATPSCQPPWS